jgi:thiosulfate reductase cytochrome b subunit
MAASLLNGHIRQHLHIRNAEWAPKHIWRDVKNHARLRFDAHNAATYNILQKFSYVGVIFILLPLMIFTGLAMSPAMNAALPWLHDIFAGRQSARSIHFMCAALLSIFVLLHLLMVFLSGPIKGIRSMITGKFAQAPESNSAGVAS